MDRKVSVSRFLQQARRAPGAKPPPPPPPRPSPPPSPADWRTMKRPTNGTIGFGALLLGIVILIVAVLPPRSQSPTTVPASTTPVREPSRPENGRVWVLSGDQAGGLRKRLNQLVDEVDDFLEVSRARRGTPWRLVRAAEKIPRRAL
jgi:hypothetical protein